MKTSSSIVRDGVSWRYLFQTWTMISWGEDLADKELEVKGLAGVTEGVEMVPDAVRAAGGGFAAATGVAVFEAAE
jgi:hypothetical protein